MFSWRSRAPGGSVLDVPQLEESLSHFNWIFGEGTKKGFNWSPIYIEAHWIIENGVHHHAKGQFLFFRVADGFGGRQQIALSIAPSYRITF